jgi:MFS family permease
VLSPDRRVVRSWHDHPHPERADEPRDGLLLEVADGRDRFVQADGPFGRYERVVERDGSGRPVADTTTYRLSIPWFGWLFRWPVRASLRSHHRGHGVPPPWAPPDRLTPEQALVLGLLAGASLTSAFVNTLFTQTVNFAANDFGMDEQAQSVAGVIVRFGIVLALPFAILADRLGRRRMIVLLAWLAPLLASLGAAAPGFWTLTATQTVARPLGIGLDLLIAVAAAEQMPRNSRAYAVSVLAMASGLGAGVAVLSLPLADLASGGWRLVYLVSFVWLFVAVSLSRRLTETPRFEAFEHLDAAEQHRRAHVNLRRFAAIGAAAFLANLFIAPASFFQNRYLDDVRGYSAAGITLFTIITATPASIGFVVGGKVADNVGRRRLLATAFPIATASLVGSFTIGGWPMWVMAFLAGLLGGMAYPAFAVYRTELFPTGRRGRSAGLLAALALVGGSVGILVAGELLDRGWSYGSVMGVLALAQVVAAAVVLLSFPETAHRTLEEINPQDAPVA